MKFVHMSEIRLGLHSESGRKWAKERVEEVHDSFRRALDRIEQDGTQLVLLSGGLFAHRPVTAELEEAARLFAGHPGMEFVVIAGHSDPLQKNSPVISFRWPENVHYCLQEGPQKICLPQLSAAVYAVSETGTGRTPEELVQFFEEDPDREQRTCLALMSVPAPEKAGCFADSGFSYVALGGRHSHELFDGGRICYAGGFEPADMTDVGEHGYLTGILQEGPQPAQAVRFCPFTNTSYVPLRVTVDPSISNEQLEQMAAEEITKRGVSNIYRIHILGEKDPETVFSLSGIRQKYRITDVVDETVPRYDFEKLYAEHAQDLIGYYISALARNRETMSRVDQKAMFYGIDALIRTAGTREAEAEQ